VKEIPLTKGYVALVDDKDYERVTRFTWHAGIDHRAVYGQRYVAGTTIQLHRFILGITDPKTQIDHEDHNGLNCQKHNLRVCSNGQNQANRRKQESSSQFKGVCWETSKAKWRAQMQVNHKNHFLGYFSAEEAAAHAYDTAAREHFGEFAHTNFHD
jgi:hypothetical protein